MLLFSMSQIYGCLCYMKALDIIRIKIVVSVVSVVHSMGIFFFSSEKFLRTLFSLFYLRDQWDMCLGCIFLSLFWLSLCKIFFIYFSSCPIVTNYIVKKQKKSVASVVSGPSRDFLFWSMSWKRSSQSQARSNGQIMANLRERKIS